MVVHFQIDEPPTSSYPRSLDSATVRVRCLGDLGLSPAHDHDLSRQGFIAQERRGNRSYFKLRFRSGNQQIVRSLGTDAQLARAIARELRQLQSARRAELRLRRLVAEARRLLRRTTQTLKPLLEERGFRLHGRAIRRRKQARAK
jgi:hypothetical protein